MLQTDRAVARYYRLLGAWLVLTPRPRAPAAFALWTVAPAAALLRQHGDYLLALSHCPHQNL